MLNMNKHLKKGSKKNESSNLANSKNVGLIFTVNLHDLKKQTKTKHIFVFVFPFGIAFIINSNKDI